MNFFKVIFISLLFIYVSNVSMADSHDNEQDIIEKAKEINQKVKENQANTQANISTEINIKSKEIKITLKKFIW